MLHLSLFGRPHLRLDQETSANVPIASLPIAVMARLAVAGSSGLSRDRLLALIWPDVDEAKAAHRLTQVRYALRKSLGFAPISGVLHLSLDKTVLSNDADLLTSAMASRDYELAAEIAELPFMDSFSFRDSPDFEGWVEEQRRDYGARLDAVLEKLATAAEGVADSARAAHWLERIVRRDPTNVSVCIRALVTLEANGDIAQARSLANWIERQLREEYEAAPDDALLEVIQRLNGQGRPDGSEAQPTVAVLPLQNVSPEAENDFFSDGMTDEIMAALSRVPGLRVASRTSSYAFKGKDIDVRQIAGRLGARLVVEGSVRKVGNRIRLSAQLTSANDGCQLWSDTFDRTLSDVFDLQTELATAIVAALPLELKLSGPRRLEARPTTDPETYTLYLKGKYWSYKRTIDGLRLASEYFEQAIERDPAYPLSWTGLADCQTMLGFSEFGNLPPHTTMPRAKAAAARALEINSDLAEAHLASGVLSLVFDWNWVEAERSMSAALKLDPRHPMTSTWYGMLLSSLGRHDEAIDRIKHAAALDPLSVTIHLSVGRALYFARRYEEALRTIRAAAELDPRHPNVHIWLSRTLLASGDLKQALQSIESIPKLPGLEGYIACLRATAQRASGQESAACDASLPYAFMLGFAGQIEAGISGLERCFADRLAHMAWIGVEPLCDPMRAHPRFKKLVKKMRVPGVAPVAQPTARRGAAVKVVKSDA